MQADHPVANYRYGHLLYAENEYALAAYHLKKVVDGSPEQCLDETQLLIANIITVNCGLSMAVQAIQEVDELEGNNANPADAEKRNDFLSRMLVDSKEMLEQHMYLKVTDSGSVHISRDQYITEKEIVNEKEVKICITPNYRMMFFEHYLPQTISQTVFYVTHTILMSAAYLETNDISEMLKELEQVVKPDAIRKCLSPLNLNVPFGIESSIRMRGEIIRHGEGEME